MQPWQTCRVLLYLPIATETLRRKPASVLVPSGTTVRSWLVTENDESSFDIWFFSGMILSNTSFATATKSGWATHVPSCPERFWLNLQGFRLSCLKVWCFEKPSVDSLSLSFWTKFKAFALADWSFLIGICAAIPPMAAILRLWQTWIHCSV